MQVRAKVLADQVDKYMNENLWGFITQCIDTIKNIGYFLKLVADSPTLKYGDTSEGWTR